MITLSERLKKIANYIDYEEDIADIGTDHGYLPLYLREENPGRKVIFTDLNEGPLSKTRNIILTKSEDADLESFDIRIGDGLSPLVAREVDAVVIAGMGGILITEILSKDQEKSKSYKKIILQPRTAADKLRKWLIDEQYHIYDESLAYENGRICEIIAVDTNSGKRNGEFKDELDYEFSPLLVRRHDEIAQKWLKNLLSTERKIEHSISTTGSADSKEKLTGIKKRIDKLETLLEEF